MSCDGWIEEYFAICTEDIHIFGVDGKSDEVLPYPGSSGEEPMDRPRFRVAPWKRLPGLPGRPERISTSSWRIEEATASM